MGVFCVTDLGGLYLEGLIHGGAYFRNFTVTEQSSLKAGVRLMQTADLQTGKSTG